MSEWADTTGLNHLRRPTQGVSVASRPGEQDAQRPSAGSGAAALPSHLYAQSEIDWLPAQ
jgi:hypothetical protein